MNMCLQAQMCKVQACAPSFFQHCAHQVLQSRPNPSCTKEQCCERRACSGPKRKACTGPKQQTCSGSMQHELDEGPLHHRRWSIHTQQGQGGGVLKTAPFAVDTFGPCVSKLRCAKCKHAHHPFFSIVPTKFCRVGRIQAAPKSNVVKEGPAQGQSERPAQGQNNRPAQGQCSMNWMKGHCIIVDGASIPLMERAPGSRPSKRNQLADFGY